eukprot:TRINITY_DN9119_c1_g3_i4.p1 TRINITY_DN9119_c1_g3~~TRINITY_DN9119_c1_g3_i4.p1  ORF type:complete len:277 (-),score=58.75 TRINITY_DN9119_c1_g3_i4:33-863(-)
MSPFVPYIKIDENGNVLDPEDLKDHSYFPSYKPKGQKWGVFCMENEMYYPLLVDEDYLAQFDYTMTIKQSSDIQVPYYNTREEYYLEPIQHEKTHLSLFIASNCADYSDRKPYIKALMEHMDVSSTGACLQNAEFEDFGIGEDNGESSKYELMSMHKFYFAFENALLEDYITEKFWGAFHAGTVPVYRGAPNVADYAPHPKSYIDVNDFSGPEDLSRFLLKLDDDDELYNEYLDWRKEGFSDSFKKLIVKQRWDSRCVLCLKILAEKDPRYNVFLD